MIECIVLIVCFAERRDFYASAYERLRACACEVFSDLKDSDDEESLAAAADVVSDESISSSSSSSSSSVAAAAQTVAESMASSSSSLMEVTASIVQAEAEEEVAADLRRRAARDRLALFRVWRELAIHTILRFAHAHLKAASSHSASASSSSSSTSVVVSLASALGTESVWQTVANWDAGMHDHLHGSEATSSSVSDGASEGGSMLSSFVASAQSLPRVVSAPASIADFLGAMPAEFGSSANDALPPNLLTAASHLHRQLLQLSLVRLFRARQLFVATCGAIVADPLPRPNVACLEFPIRIPSADDAARVSLSASSSSASVFAAAAESASSNAPSLSVEFSESLEKISQQWMRVSDANEGKVNQNSDASRASGGGDDDTLDVLLEFYSAELECALAEHKRRVVHDGGTRSTSAAGLLNEAHKQPLLPSSAAAFSSSSSSSSSSSRVAARDSASQAASLKIEYLFGAQQFSLAVAAWSVSRIATLLLCLLRKQMAIVCSSDDVIRLDIDQRFDNQVCFEFLYTSLSSAFIFSQTGVFLFTLYSGLEKSTDLKVTTVCHFETASTIARRANDGTRRTRGLWQPR